MSEDVRPPGTKPGLRELGPAWISSIGGLIVALTGAGFFVGQATVSKTTVTPKETVTVVRTVVLSPSPADSAAANPDSTANSSGAGGASSNGSVLGSYSVDIGAGHSIPLTATAPTQADFSTGGLGDLGTATPADHLVFVPINGDKMLSLPAGTTPSYQGCSTDTVFATQADSAVGTSFCLIENGRLAGVTVSAAQSSYVVLKVTVWQYISS